MCLPSLCGCGRRVAGDLLPSGCCGSLCGVFDVKGRWNRVDVHVICACVSVPLRPVLHADSFCRWWVPFSCILLDNLVVYVFC